MLWFELLSLIRNLKRQIYFSSEGTLLRNESVASENHLVKNRKKKKKMKTNKKKNKIRRDLYFMKVTRERERERERALLKR